MFFTTVCPSCGSALRLDEEYAGHEARCGRCGAVFTAAPAADDDPFPRRSARRPDPPRPRREPDEPDDRDDFDDRPRRRKPARADGSGLAIAGLALGIMSLLTWWFPPAGLVVGGAAVLLGGYGLGSRARSLAVTGIVFGLVGLIFSLGCGVWWGLLIQQEVRLRDDAAGRNPPPFVKDAK